MTPKINGFDMPINDAKKDPELRLHNTNKSEDVLLEQLAKTKEEERKEQLKTEATDKLAFLNDTHARELTVITDLRLAEQQAIKINNLNLEFKEGVATEMMDALLGDAKIYGDYPLVLAEGKRSSIMKIFCENGIFYAQDPIQPITGNFTLKLEFSSFSLSITNTLTKEIFPCTLTYENIISLRFKFIHSRELFNFIVDIITTGNIHRDNLTGLINQMWVTDFYPKETNFFDVILERRNENEVNKITSEVVNDFSNYGIVVTAARSIVVNSITKEQLSLTDFKKIHKDKVKVLNHRTGRYDSHSSVELWENSPMKKTYNGFVWDPSGLSSDKLFNTWLPFPIETAMDTSIDVTLYENFELNTMCGGDKDKYKLLCAFYAQMVQEPSKKLGSAVVVFSNSEEIKDTYFRAKQNIFQEYYLKATQKKDLTGANPDLKTSLLLEIDNTLTVGKKATVDIDTLVRDDTILFEDKGKIESGLFFSRIIINASSPIFAAKMRKMGRYIVPKPDESILDDRDQMDALHQLIIHPKFAVTMIHKYRNFDYIPYVSQLTNVTEPILTNDEKMEAFTPVENWLWEFIQKDKLSDDIIHKVEDNGNLKVSKSDLYERYKEYTKDNATTNAIFGREFDAILRSLGVLVKNDTNTKIKTKTAKIIKPLAEIRNSFISYYKMEDYILTEASCSNDENQEQVASKSFLFL